MSYYSIPLKAGQPFRQDTQGKLLLVDSIGAANGVDVMLTKVGGSDGTNMPNRQAAFRLVEPYEAVTFTSSVDTVIGVFLSNSDVQLGLTAGSGISIPGGVEVTNSAGAPIPVNFAGTVAPVIGTLDNDDAHAVPVRVPAGSSLATTPYQAQAIADPAPVAVGAVATALVAASAARRGLRIKNAGANPMAIGGAGVSFANAAVLLQPGETWNENEAPGAAWYAICAAGLNSTANLQTIA